MTYFLPVVFLGCLAVLGQEKVARVSGRVVRADTGEPIAKAIVMLRAQDQASAESGERATSAGPDGTFLLSGLAPGSYVIEAEKAGFVFKFGRDPDFKLSAGEDKSDLTIRLTPAAVISGIVQDADDEPVEGLTVMALHLRYQRGGVRELSQLQPVVSDDQGRFRIYGMSEGLYYLRTGGRLQRPMTTVPLKINPERGLEYGDSWYPEEAFNEEVEPIRLAAGQDLGGVRIRVKPSPVFRITGRVEGDAKKFGQLQVGCAKVLPFTFLFGFGCGDTSEGFFELRGLEPGEYVLKVEGSTPSRSVFLGSSRAHLVDKNLQVTIPIGQAAGVSGVVSEEGRDSLPAGLQVVLYESGSIAIYLSDLDTKGAFDVGNVPAGEFRFGLFGARRDESYYIKAVRCTGTDYTTQAVKLDAGVPLSDCRIQISRETGVVRGDVMDGEKPLSGMWVVLIPESRELRRVRRYTLRVKTDAAGKFEIRNAIPGKYALVAVAPNDESREFAIGFADRHANDAQSVEVKAGESQTVSLRSVVGR